MGQTMTPEGRKRLIAREGFKTTAYQDTKGIWTIGVGHTSAAGLPKVTKGLKITEAEVDEIFARDLIQYEQAVADAIHVPLSVNQRDALISICFNIGTGGFAKSTMVRRINAGASAASIREAILMWNKPKEIIGRRTSEADQYETPYRASAQTDRSGASQTATETPAKAIPPKTPKAAPGAPETTERPKGLLNLLVDRLRAAYGSKG